MTVDKYALLIMHDEFGSMIKECNPPPNLAKGASINQPDQSNVTQYDQYMNYRQGMKEIWRAKNKR